MKITKDKLLQIIKEETLALMEKEKVDYPARWINRPRRAAGREGSTSPYERPSFPLPKKKVPEPVKRRVTRPSDEENELDRILGTDSDQDLDPKTLAWIDNLIKKPDGLEQLQSFLKGLK